MTNSLIPVTTRDVVTYLGEGNFVIEERNGHPELARAPCKVSSVQAIILDGGDADLLHYGGWHWSWQRPETTPRALKAGSTFEISSRLVRR